MLLPREVIMSSGWGYNYIRIMLSHFQDDLPIRVIATLGVLIDWQLSTFEMLLSILTPITIMTLAAATMMTIMTLVMTTTTTIMTNCDEQNLVDISNFAFSANSSRIAVRMVAVCNFSVAIKIISWRLRAPRDHGNDQVTMIMIPIR